MEEINIKEFINYLKDYYLSIIAIVVFALCAVYVFDVVLKSPKYTTYTTIVLVKENNSGYESISQNDVTLNQKLVPTYRQLVKSDLVLEQVINNLNLDYSVANLSKEITVEAIADTEILKINVTDKNPQLAANIANTTAKVFETEVSKIYRLDNISIIDVAKVPDVPSNNTLIRDLVIAIFVSLFGITGVIFIIYYFDDTINDTEDLEETLGLPIVARVYKDNSNIELLVDEQPKSATSESIRSLRANLQFSSVDDKIQTILVTSTMASEGKSFVSANLAISFAQAGKKVLLVDCDLRKGRQHHLFKVIAKNGLSNLLVNDIKKDMDIDKFICQTKIDNVSLISRGSLPPNPSELLSSKKMKKLLNILKEKYDVVILDGAPCSGLSDSLALSSIADRTLIVCSVGYAQKKNVINLKKDLTTFKAKIAGCIINNVNHKKSSYGYYYAYEYGSKKKD